MKEFIDNTQALRVTKMNKVAKGNCRGGGKRQVVIIDKENSAPLPKRRRASGKPLGLYRGNVKR